MSFNLMLPPILGVVGLAIAFVIYNVMSRAPDGGEKERGIAQQIPNKEQSHWEIRRRNDGK